MGLALVEPVRARAPVFGARRRRAREGKRPAAKGLDRDVSWDADWLLDAGCVDGHTVASGLVVALLKVSYQRLSVRHALCLLCLPLVSMACNRETSDITTRAESIAAK